ncbi:MAG TPA: sensor histidine kinase, partial [Polyangiaceae bacterium]|nr:sensor histidine kinase [Polyangiaceae bacterium]
MFGRRLLVWLTGAVGLLVAVLALRGAVSWYHRPFVGVLVDADGTVSSFGLPTWGGLRSGLRYPDRIVEVDGMTLSSGARSGEELNQAVLRAAARG